MRFQHFLVTGLPAVLVRLAVPSLVDAGATHGYAPSSNVALRRSFVTSSIFKDSGRV